MSKILMIEDDLELAEILTEFLEQYDFEVTTEDDPFKALSILKLEKFDAVILDLTLPGMDGLEVCEAIRARQNIPIIISSARSDVTDKINALELGADDYLPKPYDPRELEARIHSVLRRYDAASALASENACDFKLNESAMLISYKNRPLELTNAEYGILAHMIKKQGMVVSREDLIHNVSAINEDSSNKSIDVMMGRIRNKLGDKTLIESIRGIGYKLLK
ncbi:MAG: response regulator transcription factor [Sulfuricurvum sp.]|uniref:response regulator transcription factor n=1 Tax=Sulfuricurvum sp. TaxID=2025608 RepID=UPI00261EC62A|nr:response regulator transcription factor [Sulfuricurvum sp.]MDD2837994.1 response regulator transcription factor [Sulfuricurvum sp.]MDD3596589.1 response regulator transcription factor [Sulfuricurvum sp.]MDD4884380.1 response regulator transcription factor [Sulfuricurvum sp.]